MLELPAVAFGLACVWLTVRQNIWCWPTGLVMVSLYIVIFYEARLYSDMLLQVVYVFLQFYGWHVWLHGGPDRNRLSVSRMSARQAVAWLSVCGAGTVLLGTLMHRNTDASFPYPDAFTTVASLIAQWLMARKVLESWLVWIIVDVVSIGLYLAKELYPTAGLYMVFLFLATLGYFAWRRTVPVPVTG